MYKTICENRHKTHMHVIGSSGFGKSKLQEWLMRQDLKSGKGFCLIDWHGVLYQDLINFLSVVNPARPVILLNPSSPSHIVGFNPWLANGLDISTAVSRRIDATIKPWGMANTNETPSLERVCRMLYDFAVRTGETLPNASLLLRQHHSALREYAISQTPDSFMQEEWRFLQDLKTPREWREQVLSTHNRVARFVGSTSIRRFIGLKTINIDIPAIMDSGAILLVNLGYSDHLDRDSAKVFGALLLNEFFEASMRRALRERKPSTYSLYLDEFQEFITDDMASMLDQVRKGGLHLVLGHQRLGQLDRSKELLESVLTNAKVRAVFGGLAYENALTLAVEMFLEQINERRIKETNYRTVPKVRESTRIVRSRGKSKGVGSSHVDGLNVIESESEGESGHHATANALVGHALLDSDSSTSFEGETESYTVVPYNEVYYELEKTGSVDWTWEEKASQEAQKLIQQNLREVYIKIMNEPACKFEVPFVKPMRLFPASLERFAVRRIEASGGLPAPEIDRLIALDQAEFLERAKPAEMSFVKKRRS